MKNNIEEIKRKLKKEKIVALVAPSFVAEFDYPEIIIQLKELGFDKIVELTFGAKMINRLYHEQLRNIKNDFLISSVCPGIVQLVKQKYPELKSKIIQVDSPMTATGKICRKIYPNHKTCFMSPCQFKKIEAESDKNIDYVIDYNQLKELIKNLNKEDSGGKHNITFDKFYNDYTKIYPLAGGLSKTAHLKGVLKKEETVIIDGVKEVEKYLKKIGKIKFLDVNFCKGGCIGGPCLTRGTIEARKKRVIDYMNKSKKENIPDEKKGIIRKADGVDFKRKIS